VGISGTMEFPQEKNRLAIMSTLDNVMKIVGQDYAGYSWRIEKTWGAPPSANSAVDPISHT